MLIIGTTMTVILLLNFLIQREDDLNYLKSNSALIMKQISSILERNEQNVHNKEEIDDADYIEQHFEWLDVPCERKHDE